MYVCICNLLYPTFDRINVSKSESSDLHWLGKPCIIGEISHLHLA